MKKFFIVLAVAVALIFTVAPSQARLGGPDLEPGNDVLLPFFIASMPGYGNINTLLVFEDMLCGLPPRLPTGPQVAFTYTVYDRKSATVYNSAIRGTECDIISTDALTIISYMSEIDRAKLEYDMDGDGTNDTYVGYIYFSNVTANNTIGAQILLVDLARGMASSANAPVKEFAFGNESCASMVNFNHPGPIYPIEAFSPNALADAKSALMDNGGPEACLGTFAFGLFPRYYVNSANGATWFFFWKSYNNNSVQPRLPANGNYHVLWFDNEEHYVSSSFDWPYELLIMNVEKYIPAALWPSNVYPKEGFVQWIIPDINNVGFYGDEEYLGYAWLKDEGRASESWTVLNPVWEDAPYFTPEGQQGMGKQSAATK